MSNYPLSQAVYSQNIQTLVELFQNNKAIEAVAMVVDRPLDEKIRELVPPLLLANPAMLDHKLDNLKRAQALIFWAVENDFYSLQGLSQYDENLVNISKFIAMPPLLKPPAALSAPSGMNSIQLVVTNALDQYDFEAPPSDDPDPLAEERKALPKITMFNHIMIANWTNYSIEMDQADRCYFQIKDYMKQPFFISDKIELLIFLSQSDTEINAYLIDAQVTALAMKNGSIIRMIVISKNDFKLKRWELFDTSATLMHCLILQSRLYETDDGLKDPGQILSICVRNLDVADALLSLFKDFPIRPYLKDDYLYLYAPTQGAQNDKPQYYLMKHQERWGTFDDGFVEFPTISSNSHDIVTMNVTASGAKVLRHIKGWRELSMGWSMSYKRQSFAKVLELFHKMVFEKIKILPPTVHRNYSLMRGPDFYVSFKQPETITYQTTVNIIGKEGVSPPWTYSDYRSPGTMWWYWGAYPFFKSFHKKGEEADYGVTWKGKTVNLTPVDRLTFGYYDFGIFPLMTPALVTEERAMEQFGELKKIVVPMFKAPDYVYRILFEYITMKKYSKSKELTAL